MEDKLSEIFKNNKGIVRNTYFEKKKQLDICQLGVLGKKMVFLMNQMLKIIVLNLRVNKSTPNRCQQATSTWNDWTYRSIICPRNCIRLLRTGLKLIPALWWFSIYVFITGIFRNEAWGSRTKSLNQVRNAQSEQKVNNSIPSGSNFEVYCSAPFMIYNTIHWSWVGKDLVESNVIRHGCAIVHFYRFSQKSMSEVNGQM